MADESVPEWLKTLRRMKEDREATQTAPEKASGIYQRKPSKPGRWETRPDWFCGAKNRAGLPCRMLAIYDNGRCKWHGGNWVDVRDGLSTNSGPILDRFDQIAVTQYLSIMASRLRQTGQSESRTCQDCGACLFLVRPEQRFEHSKQSHQQHVSAFVITIRPLLFCGLPCQTYIDLRELVELTHRQRLKPGRLLGGLFVL